MTNLYAFTEAEYQPNQYPAFVSLNVGMGECITLTVRSHSDSLHQGVINLTPEQCQELSTAFLKASRRE
jgi:hypothetical protein